MLSIIVNGAKGKMGSITCQTIKQHPDFTLIAELGKEDDLERAIQNCEPDIVIDFTNAQSAFQNCLSIIKNGARPVIGTSGLTQENIKALNELCLQKKIGGIIAPNFSIGAVLMMKFSVLAAPFFEFAEIIELHHDKKKDAPSGTATKTAHMIAEIRENQLSTSEELLPGARGAKLENIPIHSVRLPGLLAHQEVLFGGTGELLTIRHDSTDRQGFMSGVIFACQRVMQLNQLVYGLENILL